MNISYLTVSEVKNLRISEFRIWASLDGSGSRFVGRFAGEIQPGLQPSESWTELEDLLQSSHMGCWQETVVPYQENLSEILLRAYTN